MKRKGPRKLKVRPLPNQYKNFEYLYILKRKQCLVGEGSFRTHCTFS
jgi:hypothetical protein